MSVLTDLRNRGVRDVFFLVCDGLEGLPDSVNAVFPLAIVQVCVIHLIRATLRYASPKYCDQLAKDLKAIYPAHRAGRPKAVAGQWQEFLPFLAYDVELRRVLFSTNAIESLYARYRRADTVRGALPNRAGRPQDTVPGNWRKMDPKGTGQARWAVRWKPGLNAFAVTFADRMPAAENL